MLLIPSISWDHAEGLNGIDGNVLFEDEGVTKDKTMVHAWGKDKAVEYLQKLMWRDLSECPPCMSYCKVGHSHKGKCIPMEGR